MSDYREETFLFDAGGAKLVGIIASPASASQRADPAPTLGVLVVVGGPQYRVGSHRQFVLLSRSIAARGPAVMRFDCAGMGDSSGSAREFTDRDDEIRAAIDAFVERVPTIGAIAIWGLCDAASAALLYALSDTRVKHLVLLNPWVRSQAGLARTHLKHYYTRRLVDAAFWRDLMRGRVGVWRAVRGFVATAFAARGRSTVGHERSLAFQTRMARGWRQFTGDILLIFSGDDLTAREFVDHVGRDPEWIGLLEQTRVSRRDLVDADHTFSRAEWRDRVADETANWLIRPGAPDRTRVVSSDRDDRTRVVA